jgi:ssDNA-binding Zn-finger/Zn-ribbon topoisomerase 1
MLTRRPSLLPKSARMLIQTVSQGRSWLGCQRLPSPSPVWDMLKIIVARRPFQMRQASCKNLGPKPKTVFLTVYRCPICAWTSLASGKGRFKQHRRVRHGLSGPVGSFKQVVARPKASIRRCPDCDYQCLSRRELAKHRATFCGGDHLTRSRRLPPTQASRPSRATHRCYTCHEADMPGDSDGVTVMRSAQSAGHDALRERLETLTLEDVTDIE